ncbi:unnamed protein product, partial [marine sediment metagenome]
MANIRLSKSKLQEYDLCSWKYKLKHIDFIKEPETKYAIYAKEGQDFHTMVVNFFKNVNPFSNKKFIEKPYTDVTKLEYFDNFINKFVKPILLKSCKNKAKYYFPILLEEKIYNKQYDFSGIIDAVFINNKDEEYIIMDWKTGKMKSRVEIREELAYYKLLLDESGLLDKPVKYCSMFFVKTGKLFF